MGTVYPIKRPGSTTYNNVALTIGGETREVAISSAGWITNIPSVDFSGVVPFGPGYAIGPYDEPSEYPNMYFDGSDTTIYDSPINYIDNVEQPAIHNFAYPSETTLSLTTRTSWFGTSGYNNISMRHDVYTEGGNYYHRYAWWKSRLYDLHLFLDDATTDIAMWRASLDIYITRGSSPSKEYYFTGAAARAILKIEKHITSFDDTGPWGNWIVNTATSTHNEEAYHGSLLDYNAGGNIIISQS